MNSDQKSAACDTERQRPSIESDQLAAAQLPHPLQLEVLEFGAYSLVIDARSPREYREDHIPGAINLPVVDDAEYAEVGTRHRDDPHGAYLIGVRYSLRNIAKQIEDLIAKYDPNDRMLVYCFRGGKRSKLWADNLRTIGFQVDVLRGGWKNYRRWVMASLDAMPHHFEWRVLSGSTGTGKTRLLHALARLGQQVIDLEALASHRGSLLGAIPNHAQPAQKYFDSLVLDCLRRFDTERPVWVEAESKKIGKLQLPSAIHEAMCRTTPLQLTAPMPERVRLWREDYDHLAADPCKMVELLGPLKPLVGGAELAHWRDLALRGAVDDLFERIMVKHYDPCYVHSTRRAFKGSADSPSIELPSLSADTLADVADELVRRYG